MRVASWPARSHARGNPYTTLLADALEAAGATVEEMSPSTLLRRRYDIVHVHWPEWALQRTTAASTARRSTVLLASLAIARRRGARLVWTVHNVTPHYRTTTRTSRLAWRAFRRMVDGLIVLSPTVAAAARDAFPDLASRPCTLVPHGHYRSAYPAAPTQEDARRDLGIDSGRVVLFVGQIRAYKGVGGLVTAFRALADPALTLVVAGRASEADQQALRTAAAGDRRIQFRFGYIESEEMPTLIAAADVVALPYTAVSTSGSALLALSFDRPVLAPRKGAPIDLAAELGDGWVRLYDGDIDADVLSAALKQPRPAGPAPLGSHDWTVVAERTLAAYRSLQ